MTGVTCSLSTATWSLPDWAPDGGGNGQGVHDPEYAAWLHRTIEELVVLGVIEEVKHRCFIMNKLSVVKKSGYDAVTDPNRLRLVLDQRPLNAWLSPPKYSHESMYSTRDIIEPDDHMLQTDIRQGYWHGLAHADAREYMGCQIGNRYFRWRATPMGCSTSSYLFQATQWVLSRKFRRLGIRLINYSDDYAFFCKKHEAELLAVYLRGEFEAHGLELNIEKSIFEPQRSGVVLGVRIDLDAGRFEVPPKKKLKIVRGIAELLAANRRGGGISAGAEVSARLLSKTVGHIMALHVVCGDVVRRMTRGGYSLMCVATGLPPDSPWREIQLAWDARLVLDERTIRELLFWKTAIPAHTGSPIQRQQVVPTMKLSHDAGEDAWGAILDDGRGARQVAQSEFTADSRGRSSTYRELRGLLAGLGAFADALRDTTVVVYGDNQSAVQALEIGSKKPDLQDICVRIFALCLEYQIIMVPRWLRRRHLQEEDDVSKFDDVCSFVLNREAQTRVDGLSPEGTFTHDRFASSANAREGMAFNSRFFSPGTEAVDAFTQDWGQGTDNWLHPPWGLIGRAVGHLRRCRGKGTIVVPLDTRQPWWPLLAVGAAGGVWRKGKPLRMELAQEDGLLVGPDGAGMPASRPLIGIRLDFTHVHGTTATVPGLRARLQSRIVEKLRRG